MVENYAIEVENLSKTYGNNKVVDNVSFKVEKGEVFGFLGPNGAGKTTIIRMLLGLVHPDSGNVEINGYDLKTQFMPAIKKVGAVVETPKFYEHLSGLNNLKLIKNLHPDVPEEKLEEVLRLVGLETRAKDKVKTYSLGMKQRLGIARALVNSPNVIFLDEPTNGLDPQGMIEMREMIARLSQIENITVFLTSHLLHEVEQVCTRVAIIQRGKLITESKVSELSQDKNEKLEVYTNNTKATVQVLDKLEFVSQLVEKEYGVDVIIPKGLSGTLNRVLVTQNITVDYIIPKTSSLEEKFMQITGGRYNV